MSIKIDYNNSLLALISSILNYYGVYTKHKTLTELDQLLTKPKKNIVVMLFDGMGYEILKKHLPSDAFLSKHMQGSISSIFPPTTTAATLTMETGLAPIEHGWLGWSLYFDEVNANVSIFPNTLSGSGGKSAANYHVAHQYIPYQTIYDKIADATDNQVTASCISPFSCFKSSSIDEICTAIENICMKDSRNYIYTYWPQPDSDMHTYGTTHEQITSHILLINQAIETLCKNLKDTLLIVTADHGLIDTTWRFIVDYPDIMECLLHSPSIEARTMTFFIQSGMHSQFESTFLKHFGDCYTLYTKQQVLNDKLFGDGIPNPRSEGFIGDYLAIATKNITLEYAPSPNGDIFKSSHAGMTEDEMNVPFIVVDCIK